jgi:hypothetical protein
MIRRLDVLAWFACRDLDEASAAFADLIGEGLLAVTSDREQVTGLALTAEGRTYLPPTLPWGATA